MPDEPAAAPSPEAAAQQHLVQPGEPVPGIERLVFFSDAVFAIAITLLVINLRLPDSANLPGADLGVALRGLWPQVLTYALSFAVIGLYWIAHWRRFQYIEAADDRLVALNLLQLAFIALIPFPSSVMGQHGDQPEAALLYIAVLGTAGILGPVTWVHAVRAGLTVPGLSAGFVRFMTVRGVVVPVVMYLSVPLVFVNPFLAQFAWLLSLLVQGVVSRRLRTDPAGAP
jgi:uncharacterized membrane protein